MMRKLCLLMGLMSFGWSVPVNANLIVNGSFEDVFDGAHWAGNVITAGSSAGFHPGSATDGDYIVGFGGGSAPPPPPGVLSQAFPTSVGQQYQLEFDYGSIGNAVAQFMNVRVVGQSTLLDVDVSYTSYLGYTVHAWQTQVFLFTADSPLSTLTFSDISDPYVGHSTDSAIDRVSIAPIPEPSTALLLGLGLAGMAIRKRR